jgi:glutathione synthase/RimK-type ligase-like ATP-grasp enzyme
MILILSDKNDAHANHLIEKVKAENLPYYRMNLDVESLQNTYYTYRNGNIKIIQYGIALTLSDIQCVWNRRTFVELLLEESYNQNSDFKLWKNEWNKTLIGIYNNLKNIPWLNPWRLAFIAENKYLQMEVAKRLGFKLPEILISNEIDELKGFVDSHDSVVLKLMNQDFYKTDENEFKGIYVNKINSKDLERFGDSKENPIVLQKYIEKSFEVRYTVVGQDHFACKIDSQVSKIANVDWRRYDIPNTPHSKIIPPKDIQEKVSLFMKDFGVEYGALDFIVDINNDWYFLEINSMGQFLWIEDLTDLKISESIVNWFKNKLKIGVNNYESILN